jgi:hypothetical protein
MDGYGTFYCKMGLTWLVEWPPTWTLYLNFHFSVCLQRNRMTRVTLLHDMVHYTTWRRSLLFIYVSHEMKWKWTTYVCTYLWTIRKKLGGHKWNDMSKKSAHIVIVNYYHETDLFLNVGWVSQENGIRMTDWKKCSRAVSNQQNINVYSFVLPSF